MTIQTKLHFGMIEASRSGKAIRRDNIKFLLGQFQNASRNKDKTVTDEEAIAIVKKIMKSTIDLTLPMILKDPAKGEGCQTYLETVDFIDLCKDIVPAEATEDQIRDFVKNIDFSKLKSPMQAISLTVKHFNGAADGALVKKLIEEIK